MSSNRNCTLVTMLIVAILSVGAVMAGTVAQKDIWERLDKSQLPQPGIADPAMPNSYETFRLNKPALEELLKRAPEEFKGGDAGGAVLGAASKEYRIFFMIISANACLRESLGILLKSPRETRSISFSTVT